MKNGEIVAGQGLSINKFNRARFVGDRVALKVMLLDTLESHPPTRLVTAHGTSIDSEVQSRLKRLIEAGY